MTGADTHFQVSQRLACLYAALDDRDYAAVAASFDPMAVWHRQGRVLQGREAILAALHLRSASLVVHHVWGNLRLDDVAGPIVRARYLLTVYQADPGPDVLPGPLTATAPQVGWCDADFDLRSGAALVIRMAASSPTFKAARPG